MWPQYSFSIFCRIVTWLLLSIAVHPTVIFDAVCQCCRQASAPEALGGVIQTSYGPNRAMGGLTRARQSADQAPLTARSPTSNADGKSVRYAAEDITAIMTACTAFICVPVPEKLADFDHEEANQSETVSMCMWNTRAVEGCVQFVSWTRFSCRPTTACSV